MKIFTVGYEGCEIDEFVAALKKSGVDCVADVRKNSRSRKKGFSKTGLSEKLEAKGIDYVHFPSLGVPAEWRKRAKKKLITREQMFKDYTTKILPKHKAKMDEVLALAKTQKVALLCYEADPLDCHRHYLAQALKRKNKTLKVTDLHVQPKEPRLLRVS